MSFEDLPLFEMVKAIDAKLDKDKGAAEQPVSPYALPRREGAGRRDSERTARARRDLEEAEAMARQLATEPPLPEATTRTAPERVDVILDMVMESIMEGLREFARGAGFREAIRMRLVRHLLPEEPPELPKPWEALGLAQVQYRRLKATGALKED